MPTRKRARGRRRCSAPCRSLAVPTSSSIARLDRTGSVSRRLRIHRTECRARPTVRASFLEKNWLTRLNRGRTGERLDQRHRRKTGRRSTCRFARRSPFRHARFCRYVRTSGRKQFERERASLTRERDALREGKPRTAQDDFWRPRSHASPAVTPSWVGEHARRTRRQRRPRARPRDHRRNARSQPTIHDIPTCRRSPRALRLDMTVDVPSRCGRSRTVGSTSHSKVSRSRHAARVRSSSPATASAATGVLNFYRTPQVHASTGADRRRPVSEQP